MKELYFRVKKSLRIKKPEPEKSIELWIYGYYACSSLCMVPTIDLSKDKQ